VSDTSLKMECDRVTYWMHPITLGEAKALHTALQMDQFETSAKEMADRLGFRPDVPGYWHVAVSADWPEVGRLQWSEKPWPRQAC
jgi:hypothetical protein